MLSDGCALRRLENRQVSQACWERYRGRICQKKKAMKARCAARWSASPSSIQKAGICFAPMRTTAPDRISGCGTLHVFCEECGFRAQLMPRVSSIGNSDLRTLVHPARYFFFGGYFSMDFLTMSSSLPWILEGSLFSWLAMARQTSERVVGSRRSMTSVPSA